MTDTIKLKPCPFCGCEAENTSHQSCDCCGKRYTGEVTCKHCRAAVKHFDTDEEAVALWNTRPNEDALVAALKRSKAVMKPKTIREIIQSGDDVIFESGLNPYCMNEGRASGDEQFDCSFIDEALKQAGAE